MSPADVGIAAAGGGTPADQGMAAARDGSASVEDDAMILVEDHIQYAVYEGLEELGLDENGANEVIRVLYNRPDLLKGAIVTALNDYKRKLNFTGRPKPRNPDLFK